MTVIDPLGPVFICHRGSDGSDLAVELAWSLRAQGVPVWLDRDDLPPGDIHTRLHEALSSGLSGAILLITPEVGQSRIVKSLELPRLYALKARPEFTFLVASTIPGESMGEADHRRSDDLLECVPPNLLSLSRHYWVENGDPKSIAAVAREMARQRMRLLARGGGSTLVMDVEGRTAVPGSPVQAGLVVRYPPAPEGQWAPSPDVWTRLLPLINSVSELTALAAADEVLVRGGMHLSLAFAFGAALPKTARARVRVEDREGNTWVGQTCDLNAGLAIVSDIQLGSRGLPIAVLVDLVPTPMPHDTFRIFIDEIPAAFSGTVRITAAAQGYVSCDSGALISFAVASAIREFAAERDTCIVHLFLRTPAPLALLLGREFNTLSVHLYEWERQGPCYVPSIVVSSGGAVVARLQAQDDVALVALD